MPLQHISNLTLLAMNRPPRDHTEVRQRPAHARRQAGRRPSLFACMAACQCVLARSFHPSVRSAFYPKESACTFLALHCTPAAAAWRQASTTCAGCACLWPAGGCVPVPVQGLLTKLRARIPGLALRTTFINGFPGEDEAQHRDLVNFVKTFK